MKEIDLVRETLDELAVFVRARYAARETLDIAEKGQANDLVTEVDLAVQERIRRRIAAEYPGDAIVGEEAGLDAAPHDGDARVWLIDPIDGTQNFVRGLFPSFGVSLALAVGGVPCVGGVALPGAGQLFLAERGAGAVRNGERIRVSRVIEVHRARAEIDFSTQNHRAATLDAFGLLIKTVGQVRCYCAAVIGLCSIATGDADAYVHVELNPWDYAAAQVIVEEAGGTVTRLDGQPIHLFRGDRGVLASNGPIHAELQALIAKSG